MALAQGQSVAQVCRALGVTEQTYYRWRKEYGGMQVAQAKRLKQLEGENARPPGAVANQILREAAEGAFRALRVGWGPSHRLQRVLAAPEVWGLLGGRQCVGSFGFPDRLR